MNKNIVTFIIAKQLLYSDYLNIVDIQVEYVTYLFNLIKNVWKCYMYIHVNFYYYSSLTLKFGKGK